MPGLPLQRCGYAGCRELYPGAYCATHRAVQLEERKALIKGGWSGKDYGSAWAKLSKRIRKREPVCRVCKCRAAVAVDHIVPKFAGGTDDERNLQPICKMCHDAKNVADRAKYK